MGVPKTSAVRETTAFRLMSAQRVLIFGGIALIIGGMLFGDIFAVFVLHQNGGATGATLLAASQAVSSGDAIAVKASFTHIGSLLEDHGTKVDAHVHMTDAGYLALLLALLQPYVSFSEKSKRRLAWWFVTGGVLLPTGIFLIHYVGLAYSFSPVIGWASVLADSAGAILIVVVIAELWGLCCHFRRARTPDEQFVKNTSHEQRLLMSGGTVLILLGFLHGAWYAGVDLYRHEASETRILNSILDNAVSGSGATAAEVAEYGALAAERAVKIAAHSHIIEFGLLAILLSFVQPFIYLSDRWKRRWIVVLLTGSVVLPVFVLLEIRFGLIAGGIADAGGLMVIIALVAMMAGVLRYSGQTDSATGGVA